MRVFRSRLVNARETRAFRFHYSVPYYSELGRSRCVKYSIVFRGKLCKPRLEGNYSKTEEFRDPFLDPPSNENSLRERFSKRGKKLIRVYRKVGDKQKQVCRDGRNDSWEIINGEQLSSRPDSLLGGRELKRAGDKAGRR